MSSFGPGWGWVGREGLQEAETAPVVSGLYYFPCPQAIEIEERRIQSCVHFMTLKKLNRLAHIRLKKGRDQTHEVELKDLINPPSHSSTSPSLSSFPLF